MPCRALPYPAPPRPAPPRTALPCHALACLAHASPCPTLPSDVEVSTARGDSEVSGSRQVEPDFSPCFGIDLLLAAMLGQISRYVLPVKDTNISAYFFTTSKERECWREVKTLALGNEPFVLILPQRGKTLHVSEEFLGTSCKPSFPGA